MAWYTIEHSCGHLGERQIYGTNVHGERERKAATLGRSKCPDCAEIDRVAASAAAAAVAGDLGWPELLGSQRQKAWAQRLRLETVDQLDQLCRDAGMPSDRHDWARGVLLAQVSATQWTSYRGGNPRRSRTENCLNLTDLMPVPELVRAWATDPARDIADAFCARLKQKGA
ncbi:hypothetical protein AB0H00_29665 [Nocardia sp. NPDC023852]|uniref:hypothetical protein n=1 Tax=Nocardia sp. NPDC023852 TaxID=3154697 RepID=UPI0033E3BDDD